ncbi:SAM-dependent methyltransferase [Actinomadura logoneensis]|uniref:SAM-dependent methyltransferase n=1 Tax=Actinomadura logoneensis TaxID=2293572 RepID=UPI0013140200|nr:SAM-dependent methyltransferase [Actinomadura logoneensis]
MANEMSLDAVPAGLSGRVPDTFRAGAAAARDGSDAAAVHAALFHGAALVRDRVSLTIDGERYAVSPVSAGFVALGAEAFPRAREVAAAALRLGRPVALIGDLAGTALALAGNAGTRWVHSPEPGEAHFLLPASFVRDRARMLRRRLTWERARPDAPPQRLTAVGVGPRPFVSPAELRALVGRAEAVVATDWTYAHTLPRLLGTPSPPGPRHRPVPYDSADYDATIREVGAALDALRDEGVRDVVLLVEGNPDTYDVLDGVRLDRRRLDVLPGVPIALVAAGEAGAPAAPARFAYLSGLPHRHGQTRRRLRAELELYLRAGITCVLVEMTYGDLDLAVQVAARSPLPKTLVLLSDAYTPHARRLVTTSRSATGTRAMLERARGTLSTLAVFDASPGRAAGGP